MSLTAEEQATLDALTAKQAAAKAASTPPAPPTKQEAAAPAAKEQSITDQAKAALEADKAASAAFSQLEKSVKFNLSVADFVEKNKALLPDEAAKILSAAATKTFKDDNERANTLRKSLLDSFLEKQENIDVLTPSLASRAAEFKALAESDKGKRSGEFWDLVENGLAIKSLTRRADALKKANGINEDTSKNIYASKLIAAARERFKPVLI